MKILSGTELEAVNGGVSGLAIAGSLLGYIIGVANVAGRGGFAIGVGLPIFVASGFVVGSVVNTLLTMGFGENYWSPLREYVMESVNTDASISDIYNNFNKKILSN